jgi:hypothetical protein
LDPVEPRALGPFLLVGQHPAAEIGVGLDQVIHSRMIWRGLKVCGMALPLLVSTGSTAKTIPPVRDASVPESEDGRASFSLAASGVCAIIRNGKKSARGKSNWSWSEALLPLPWLKPRCPLVHKLRATLG